MTTEHRTEGARAVPHVPADNGKNAMFALWLLLTTNPTFLLDPAKQAQATGVETVTLTPGADDRVSSWDALTKKLKAHDENAVNFEAARVQEFLMGFLAKPLEGDRFSSDNTYAAVLQNTCALFQEAKLEFVEGWEPPCPKTIDQIPGLGS